jgi:hypothetical protein
VVWEFRRPRDHEIAAPGSKLYLQWRRPPKQSRGLDREARPVVRHHHAGRGRTGGVAADPSRRLAQSRHLKAGRAA